jgi:hypothetical protein
MNPIAAIPLLKETSFQGGEVMTIVRRLLRRPVQNANKKTIQLTHECVGETPEEYANDSGAVAHVVEVLKRR